MIRTYPICVTTPRRPTTLLDIIRRAGAELAAARRAPRRITLRQPALD
jgi:hypothetical protein